MKTKFLFSVMLLFCSTTIISSQNNTPLWLRYPAISPDGKNIAFCYKGDIYLVDTKGGKAVPLTLNEAHDFMPTWSPDGKWIAFASDRNGNFDIYLMSAEGGN